MSDREAPERLPTAGAQRRRRLPLVWIVPLVTGVIAAWLAWDTFSKRGPTITVTFETAAGLTAGQSQLKYKNVVMGTVKSIAVAPDLANVIVTIETTHEAEPLLTDQTIFWVVRPQLFAGNITGLDTLFSGSYIGMRPPNEKGGKSKRHFVGEQEPPILQAWAKGTVYKLQSKRLGSISLGSPIFFRDLDVGTVLGWDLGDLANSVTIHAFVRAPFDQYVRDDSSFWNASGLSVKLSGDGISVQMESLRALLLGGIAFDTARDSGSPLPEANKVFQLYPSLEAAKSAGFGHQLQLLSYFPGSVAGLSVGADVTLYGLKIGEVTDVGLVFDREKDRILAPVHYRVEADRVTGIAAAQGLEPGTVAADMVRHGLRATLQSPSLITSNKIVALEMVPDAVPEAMKREGDVFVVPTSEVGGFDSIARSANELLSKINRIDFDKIGKSLEGAAAGLDETINGPQLKATLTSLQQAMAEVQNLARTLDRDSGPALQRLPAIAQQLQDALTNANKLFGSLNAGYGEDSRFRRDLDRLMPQLTDTVRSLRALTDLLARHPEALIQGRPNTGKE
ncbi:MAG: MCE family protein [Alphaproteobacteria bacterium]|nr:MCE family protein [Alphaproteobacteria bacterium]